MKNKKTVKRIIKFISITSLTFLYTCTGTPVLSDLVNSRISLIVKGTYETNDPYPQGALYMDDALTSGTLAVAPLNTPILSSDVNYFIDIAGIRVAKSSTQPTGSDSSSYWSMFAEERQVLCSTATGLAGYQLLDCLSDNNVAKLGQFFGEGFQYKAVDLPAGKYQRVAVFIRKMVTSPATLYDVNFAVKENLTTIFDNRTINGINLSEELLQFNSSDTLKSTPLLFPLDVKNANIVIPGDNKPYVMEVRIFMHNLMMQHVISNGSKTTAIEPLTFAAISDWQANHTATDISKSFSMGGNLLMNARIYVPGNTGSITITEGAAPATNKTYYAVTLAGTVFDPKASLPYAATSQASAGAGSTGTIKNLPPGSYDIYKTCDTKRMDSTGEVPGFDGFPETFDSCGTPVTVTSGSVTTIDLATCATVISLCP